MISGVSTHPFPDAYFPAVDFHMRTLLFERFVAAHSEGATLVGQDSFEGQVPQYGRSHPAWISEHRRNRACACQTPCQLGCVSSLSANGTTAAGIVTPTASIWDVLENIHANKSGTKRHPVGIACSRIDFFLCATIAIAPAGNSRPCSALSE
jgi:hypothetical protein